MKDYYYILGIKKNASIDDIKSAYRKLSVKFHPDKNEGDVFFSERFIEIQEAYETLCDNGKRIAYDKLLTQKDVKQNNSDNGVNFQPEIEYFQCNKLFFEFGEEITFSWKTINANKVFIKPFGLVQPIGQKTYKINDFKNANLTFELVAENTYINRTAKSSLLLKNKSYEQMYNSIASEILKEQRNKEREKSNQNGTPSVEIFNYDFLMILVIIIIGLVVCFILF